MFVIFVSEFFFFFLILDFYVVESLEFVILFDVNDETDNNEDNRWVKVQTITTDLENNH